MINIIIGILLSYLLGSIPTAYIFGRLLKGIDIRDHGSGNVGATNAFRVLGKIPGALVLIIDIFKGVIPLTLIADLVGIDTVLTRIVLGLSVVAGHNWTVFLKFKGGKGIATTLGVLIGLTVKVVVLRPVVFVCILAWLISFLVSGYVSLSSIIAAVLLPIIMVCTKQSFEIICLGVIFCVFVVFRHRPNILRLMSGNESRVKLPFHNTNLQ